MKNKILVLIFAIFISFGLAMQGFAITSTQNTVAKPAVVAKNTAPKVYNTANALDIVNSADKYLNKNVKVKASFDKFSTLGLDYKPAMKDSQNYIAFLIKRPDVTDRIIPLSEMKIFMKRKMAEKFIELETGDEIEFEGTVFSCALGDPWIEVDNLVITKKVAKPANKK